MKTKVLMKREIFGEEIKQDSKNYFFSATDLIKAGNRWRVQQKKDFFHLDRWLQTKGTKEFIAALEEKTGQKVLISGRGRGVNTWVHPYLFIDIALAISPDLKIQVYEWIFDKLIEYRNTSGDSYKKMTGALYQNSQVKSKFGLEIAEIADRIKNVCGVEDWQKADEKQLKYREKLQENIALLCDVLKHNEKAVELAIEKTKRGA